MSDASAGFLVLIMALVMGWPVLLAAQIALLVLKRFYPRLSWWLALLPLALFAALAALPALGYVEALIAR